MVVAHSSELPRIEKKALGVPVIPSSILPFVKARSFWRVLAGSLPGKPNITAFLLDRVSLPNSGVSLLPPPLAPVPADF